MRRSVARALLTVGGVAAIALLGSSPASAYELPETDCDSLAANLGAPIADINRRIAACQWVADDFATQEFGLSPAQVGSWVTAFDLEETLAGLTVTVLDNTNLGTPTVVTYSSATPLTGNITGLTMDGGSGGGMESGGCADGHTCRNLQLDFSHTIRHKRESKERNYDFESAITWWSFKTAVQSNRKARFLLVREDSDRGDGQDAPISNQVLYTEGDDTKFLTSYPAGSAWYGEVTHQYNYGAEANGWGASVGGSYTDYAMKEVGKRKGDYTATARMYRGNSKYADWCEYPIVNESAYAVEGNTKHIHLSAQMTVTAADNVCS